MSKVEKVIWQGGMQPEEDDNGPTARAARMVYTMAEAPEAPGGCEYGEYLAAIRGEVYDWTWGDREYRILQACHEQRISPQRAVEMLQSYEDIDVVEDEVLTSKEVRGGE